MTSYKINQLPNFHIMGRHIKDAGKKDSLSLFWAGSGLELYAKTREVWAEVESDFNSNEVWLCVWINGRKISRFMAPKGKATFCLARGLNPEKENSIILMRDTQPMSGDTAQILKITSISVNDETQFLPVPERKLKIEFIGDSITSGEGTIGAPSEMEWISQWISASENYAVKTATSLKADFNIISQCGWGVVTGWDNNITSTIPGIYKNVCGLQTGDIQKENGSLELWDFSIFKPDFIFINLGTNDSGAFNQPAWKDPVTGKEYKMRLNDSGLPNEEDACNISKEICEFLKEVRKNNPESRICWIWGMIPIDNLSPYIQKGVDQFILETGDKKTDTLLLPSMDLEKTEFEKGSRGHPGPLTHRLASEKLIEYISKF